MMMLFLNEKIGIADVEGRHYDVHRTSDPNVNILVAAVTPERQRTIHIQPGLVPVHEGMFGWNARPDNVPDDFDPEIQEGFEDE